LENRNWNKSRNSLWNVEEGLTDARKALTDLKNSESRFLIKFKKEDLRIEKC
jgi:hypothetical protein